MLFELLGVVGIGLYVHKRLKKKTLFQQLNGSRPRITPFTGDVRHRQLKELSADKLDKKSPGQKMTDRNMVIALSSMGLAAAGRVFYPPLGLLSLPGILYLTHYAVLHTYEKLFKEKKLTVDLLSALTEVFFILNGYLFLASVCVVIFSLNRKALAKISDDSKKISLMSLSNNRVLSGLFMKVLSVKYRLKNCKQGISSW
jgi:hypothetical protein